MIEVPVSIILRMRASLKSLNLKIYKNILRFNLVSGSDKIPIHIMIKAVVRAEHNHRSESCRQGQEVLLHCSIPHLGFTQSVPIGFQKFLYPVQAPFKVTPRIRRMKSTM